MPLLRRAVPSFGHKKSRFRAAFLLRAAQGGFISGRMASLAQHVAMAAGGRMELGGPDL